MINLEKDFLKTNLLHYTPVKLATKEVKILVYEGNEDLLDTKQIITHIRNAERENKIAVFHKMNITDINIVDREFYAPIIFSNCNFKGITKFTNNKFFYQLFIYSCNFEQSAKFKLSMFFNGLSVIDCLFKDETSFERVKFLATNIKFLKKEYSKLQIFYPGNFNTRNTVDFLGVTFVKTTSFVNTNFGCSILFSYYQENDTVFFGDGNFSCTIEEEEYLNLGNDEEKISEDDKILLVNLDNFHRLTFLSVKIYGELNFENRIFQKKTIFKDVVFYHAPKFHNCELHQDTDFHGADFKDTSSEGAERAYRTLKLIMDKKHAHLEQGMFFALEQKSMLNTPLRSYNSKIMNYIRLKINFFIVKAITPRMKNNILAASSIMNNVDDEHHAGFYVSLTEKIISLFYFLISNYGQSIKRPMIILLTNLFIVFPVLYYYCFGNSEIIAHSWQASYYISFQQLFKPFDIYSLKSLKLYNNTPYGLYFLATFQSIFNLGLVTLFALAIRGRFRMF